jgi:hypothetical protein
VPGKLSVVVLIDALGWEIVREFDFASGLLDRRAALGTVLGYSSAAIPSLLSGTTPEEHGSWSMYRLADGRSPFGYLRALPRLPHALEWRVRRLARRITDRRGAVRGYYDLYDIPVHVLGYFDVAQHQDPYVPGGLSRETVFDSFVRSGVRYRLWYYRTAEAPNMDELVASVGGDEGVLFFYTAELDALMHRVGIFDDAVAAKLRVYEAFLERVYDACRSHGREVNVYLLSDHGMTDVDRTVDLWGHLERRGVQLGRDYMAFYDSTMARMWCDGRVREMASSHLRETGTGRLLTEEELRSYGCWFADGRYGKSVFLADPGVMVVPSFMGRERIAAMHGYDPADRFSKGCFLTDDPSGALPSSILGFKEYLLGRTRGAA